MADCVEKMGLGFGLERNDSVVKRKHHWLFKIAGVSCQNSSVSRALPGRRGARPSLSWKEYEFQHLNESIHYPFKPEWKPVQLHLYDLQCNNNPVFNWVKLNQSFTGNGIYNPQFGTWTPIVPAQFKRTGILVMLDGCSKPIETWIFEGCYPQNIEWGDLEMDLSDVVTVDITLRYERAYIDETNGKGLVTSDPGLNPDDQGFTNSGGDFGGKVPVKVEPPIEFGSPIRTPQTSLGIPIRVQGSRVSIEDIRPVR